MAASAQLQTRLSPAPAPRSSEFSQLNVKLDQVAKDSNDKEKVDFRTIMQNSNLEALRERSAKKSGDLSAAKTDEEFKKMLSERINPTRTPRNQMDKDDFLKLFIAQMQNQDPLNPQDSTQMAAQLAQFNSLEQMMNVNKTLENLVKGQNSERALGMVNYIGKEVSLSNGKLKWDGKNVTKATFSNEVPIAEARLEVRDSSGQVLTHQDLGNIMSGDHPVAFDGKGKDGKPINPGIYTFGIVAKTMDGSDLSIPITTKVKITGLDVKEDGGALFTEVGKVRIDDIVSVGSPGFTDGLTTLDKRKAINVTPTVNQEIPKEGKQVQENSQSALAYNDAQKEAIEDIESQMKEAANLAPSSNTEPASGVNEKIDPLRKDFEIPIKQQTR